MIIIVGFIGSIMTPAVGIGFKRSLYVVDIACIILFAVIIISVFLSVVILFIILAVLFVAVFFVFISAFGFVLV